MFSFKIEITGPNKLMNGAISNMSIVTDSEDKDLKTGLGKAIYIAESAGFMVDTHSVFMEATADIDNVVVRNRFSKLYAYTDESTMMIISVKDLNSAKK